MGQELAGNSWCCRWRGQSCIAVLVIQLAFDQVNRGGDQQPRCLASLWQIIGQYTRDDPFLVRTLARDLADLPPQSLHQFAVKQQVRLDNDAIECSLIHRRQHGGNIWLGHRQKGDLHDSQCRPLGNQPRKLMHLGGGGWVATAAADQDEERFLSRG